MCGIAGIYNFASRPVDASKLRAMIDIQRHRGPDDEGIYISKNVGLGHCRLGIIDLSEQGHLPMSNREETLWCIYNGEIHNYIELREELEGYGYKFKSNTDTEVVIYSYDKWGEGCVNRFNGMWAFAIWDTNKRTLFLSRDRFGIKPFYYFRTEDSFIFASEVKSILKVISEAREVDYSEIYKFLSTGIFADSEDTFFNGIKSILPGHSVLIKDTDLIVRRYWDINRIQVSSDKSRNREDFINLLQDSINLRLRSSIPVGSCLSGGLDSSAIVMLQSKVSRMPIKTFSIVWEEPECDERRYINLITEKISSIPYSIKPVPGDFFDTLDKIVWHFDAPSQGPGVYAQWYLMNLAKGKVGVLLDGQGSDELLGGYYYYFFYYLKDLLKEGLLSKFIQEEREISALIKSSALKGVLRLLFPAIYETLRHNRAESIFNKDFEERNRQTGLIMRPGEGWGGELNDKLYNSFTFDSLPSLLHYSDRNSMAFSMEMRSPFLDHRLVEFCMNLPFNYKINGIETKRILRDAMKGFLPVEILHRRDKKGFPTPVGKWFKLELRCGVEEILNSSSFKERGIFDIERVKLFFALHCNNKRDYTFPIWQWLTVELWFRKFIDNSL